MRLRNSTDELVAPRQTRSTGNATLAGDRGSGSIEFVIWLALVALPMVWLVTTAVRFETALAAAQQIAREVAREASLGVDYQANIATLLGDYGLAPNRVATQVVCMTVPVAATQTSACALVRASVRVDSTPWVVVTIPAQVPMVKVTTP